MLPDIYHTLALTKIHRLRKFNGESNLIVKVGQKVNANEKIADIFPETKYQTVNIKKLLNFNNSQDARRAIEVETGAKIKAGEIIAQSSGIFAKTIKAQQDSEVLLINGSLVLLKQSQTPKPLIAGFESIVSEIMPGYGVILETNGVLIQCAWGNQKSDSGLLIYIEPQSDNEFTAKMIDVSHRGMVIMGSHCQQANVFKAAKDFNVRGMIFSSMNPDLIAPALEMEIPIVVVDAFTPAPMNMRAFELLKSNNKREVSLSAIYDTNRNEKAEIIIPLPAEAVTPQDSYQFSEGLIVRVNEGLFQGKAGVIKRIVNNSVTLFNGVKAICAIIQFSDDEQASIPLANLDILE